MKALVFFCLIMICLFFPDKCVSINRKVGILTPGFKASQTKYIDYSGSFLVSNTSIFGFGFTPSSDTGINSFIAVIFHIVSRRIIWSANRLSPVSNSDNFVFGNDGNAYIERNGEVVWTTNTSGTHVSSMQLLDSGNLVLVGSNRSFVWQSFSYPTNTLMPNQELGVAMKLVSNFRNNLSFSLEIKSGDSILSAGFRNPQPYWAMGKDKRKIINKNGGGLVSAVIDGNLWRFYDNQSKVFLWQFVFADGVDGNATWAAVLDDDSFVRFYNLDGKITGNLEIPGDSCSTPSSCSPYLVCRNGNTCQCPYALNAINCTLSVVSCNVNNSYDLINAGEGLSYSALGFVQPVSRTSLEGCKKTCLCNCSCLVMFFDNKSGNCYIFDQIGSFSDAESNLNVESFVKVSKTSPMKKKNLTVVAVAIVIATSCVIISLMCIGVRWHKKRKNALIEDETSEENKFLDSISGMPVRFSFKDLQQATNNFSKKLGQGGFGSVYEGVLKDGSKIAVKQLEGIGQGKKEFRAEVSSIGSIHHHHLVRLKGFCVDGLHRLLVYEYMANGSLDRWIFKKDKTELSLDWDTRYKIVVGTAKGLAYLHEECDVKIVHCDIKPENVLLDEHFRAKVSDFGLAKLMTREQSHVFTTMRGTRGYLAPEWITRRAISEKSDVYSFGMVLLEIIGGRKNYDMSMISEEFNFPTYALKMMEEGKILQIFDQEMKIDEKDERMSVVIQVALWCIKDDMNLRPSMSKVVQMLEGLCPVPAASQMGSSSGLFRSTGEEGASSGNSDFSLSGPR
ncbi:G-type lectin S-receptor-like serine/threonine-protein kinase SD2-5 [Rutidosis leptorrhynchoides]|uniref:G-type lectin S-receptor-like serine/threonine-protein kinase SD2-5 n=1 Tax=Rutidosis leptorrhynchoides TaxID=125765 RepID=UPI003A9A137B